jgi:hypothetical protein
VKGTEKITKTNNAGEFLLYDVDDRTVLIATHVTRYEQVVGVIRLFNYIVPIRLK